MKLLNIKLQNFQGVRSAEFDFGGKSASIYGDNATGKTTVFNAFTWLLFDKANTGAKNFSPKTEGTHDLDYVAEALIETDDGAQVDLRKVFHEVYKKKRGSQTKEFSGHTTEYYIDGVPTSATEFSSKVNSLVGTEEQMKMLTMPDYFPQTLSWQDRRKILLEVCGDVSDADVIENTPELKEAGFSRMLLMPGDSGQSYAVEDFRKIMTEQKKKINTQLENIPERIDEATKAMPDIGSETKETIAEKRKAAEQELAEAQALAKSDTDDGTRAIYSSISNLKYDLIEARNAYADKCSKTNEEVSKKISEAKAELRSIDDKSTAFRSDIQNKKLKLEAMESRRSILMEEYKETASHKWDDSQAVCPTCHRPFEPDQAEEMRAEFNRKRSEKLTDISKRGQECSKDKIDALKAAIDADQKELDSLTDRYGALTEEVMTLTSQLKTSPAFETTEEYKTITENIEELKQEAEIRENSAHDILSEKEENVRKKQEALNAIADLEASLKLRNSQAARIEELKEKLAGFSKAYDDTEFRIHLCEVFTKSKVQMLDKRINSRFRTLRFRLFDEQINGGIKDCCEVLIPSADGTLVPYQAANNAAKINAGLEIIHTLAIAWDIWIPVMVDNAEAVTHLTEYPDMQIIRLVVSEKDKKLRMELDEAA